MESDFLFRMEHEVISHGYGVTMCDSGMRMSVCLRLNVVDPLHLKSL